MNRQIVFIILFFLMSCAREKTENGREKIIQENKEATMASSLKEEPVKTVIDFLKWYRANENNLKQMEIINNINSDDTALFYSVNFERGEEY